MSKPALHTVETSSDQQSYLLRSPKGRYLKLTPSAYHLIRKRREGASFKELAEILRTGSGEALTEEQAEAAYNKLVDRIEAIERTDSLTRSGFWLRLPLLSERVVTRLASFFSFAYRPGVAAALLALVGAAGLWSFHQSFKPHFASGSFVAGYGLLLASILCHEIGHASACARYGVRPGAIGCGMYLIYPVFYTDVTAAWELRRWQRVVVDLGGLYFQFIVGALYACAYALWGWEPLKVGMLMIGGSLVFSLNPIFKFDGYWVITDALGVTNLSRQPRRIFTWAWKRLRRQPVAPLPWPGWVSGVLAVYSVLTFAVWGWFLHRLRPLLLLRVLPYPAHLYAFVRRLGAGPAAVSGREWGDFLVSTYVFVIAVFLISRIVLPLGRSLLARFTAWRAPAGAAAPSRP